MGVTSLNAPFQRRHARMAKFVVCNTWRILERLKTEFAFAVLWICRMRARAGSNKDEEEEEEEESKAAEEEEGEEDRAFPG